MSTSFASFSVTVGWDVAAFVGCLMVFNVLRRVPQIKKIYAPKRYVNSKYARPKQLPETYFLSWVRPLLQYTEEDVIKIAGFDAAVYLRLFSFGVRLFTVLSVFNLIMVLPVNLTGDRVNILQRIESGEVSDRELAELQAEDETLDDDRNRRVQDFEEAESVNYEISSFDRLSMTNIKPGSDRLWAHMLSVWFITLYTLKLLWQYHHKAVDLRIRFLATTENGAEAHTVLVTDVPGLRVGSPLDRLMKSALFKYLPRKVRLQVEESIELLFTVATGGMNHVNNMGAQLAKNITDQFQGPSRPSLRKTKNKRNLGSASRQASLNIRIDEEEMKLVNPEDMTDMDPVTWVTSKLANGVSLEDIVKQQFRETFPDGLVKCANIIYDTTALESLMTDYDKTVESLEDLVDHYATKINDGVIELKIKTRKLVPLVEGKWAVDLYGQRPLDVDLLRFYMEKLEHLKKRILEELDALPRHQVAAAFVTFNTRWAQTVAATAFHHHFPTFWNVQAAPNPEELVWKNLRYRGWERVARLLLTWAEFSAICVFFFIPVVFVQGLIQMDRLEQYPVIGPIVTFPLINGFLKGIIPNLALKFFLMILPAILKNMSHRQGLFSLSAIDFEVVRKYFIFQTITVFFFSFITNSILAQIQELRDNPDSLRDILGVAAPQSATFFISYILYSGLFESGISFLNLMNLAKLWLMSKFAGTERAKARIWKDQTIEYGTEVPSHTLTILLGLAFSVINPVILPVTLMYFLAMKLIWSYNMLYIYSGEYESGGKLWEHVFEHVIVGLVIMQAMMMGLFAIKRFPYSALLIPLPFLTLLFRSIAHKLYDKPLRILSLRAAHDLDVADQEETIELDVDDKGQFDKHSNLDEGDAEGKYKHPASLIDWDDLDTLLSDADNVSQLISGLNGRLTKTGYLPSSKV